MYPYCTGAKLTARSLYLWCVVFVRWEEEERFKDYVTQSLMFNLKFKA